jgi:aminopeptidase N
MSSSCTAPSTISGPIEYFRNDYLPSKYLISDVYLDFKLSSKETIVTSKSTINPIDNNADLILDGEALTLLSLSINGNDISSEYYCYNDEKLTIFSSVIPKSNESFELSTQVRIHPDTNLALTGLYSSGSNLLCTQCEAMGFRRITFHLDRPDVLSKYTVRLEADKNTYPLLLSNGNNIESGDTTHGNHYSIWFDPFPKPSYLFALVAGDLGSIHDVYVTTSGRNVKLGIYTDKENAGKLEHAMYSIKRSMKWDEDTFGLECDLDIYNIVATNDFNMGAMENKGLNIFNSAYILADSKTATDIDYDRILGVIGHEYFHNWSGNRVTVRDWFQLTLKEGLTVFRDQWFTSDVSSKIVKRIEDVRFLRGKQFPEDQGPMSHPIRPESYISMDNFYTGTVYMKGNEILINFNCLFIISFHFYNQIIYKNVFYRC